MRYRKCLMGLFFAGIILIVPAGEVLADANDVNKKMRNAERMMFSQKLQEADALLKEAEKEYNAIILGNDASEIKKVKRNESRIKKLRKDMDRKLGAGAKTSKSAVSSASTDTGGKELPSYVVNKFKTVNSLLDIGFDNVRRGHIGSARGSVDDVKVQVERMEKSYAKYLGSNHPEMQNLHKRLAELETAISQAETGEAEQKAAQAGAKAEAKAVSDEWIARLKPYATGLGQSGHDPEKYFIGSYTAQKEEMANRTRIYGEVQAEMKTYWETGPKENATEELQRLVKNLEYNIKTFNESCTSMAEMYVKEAKKKMDFLMNRVDEEVKKIGSGEMPIGVTKDALKDFRRSLDSAAGLLGKQESRVANLEKAYQDLLAKNSKITEARVAETRMLPDKFDGKEKKAVKKKAEAVLKNEYADIKVLRTTVISQDWKEESVVEWTDTTKSVLRHRVTRSVTAQVAGKRKGDTKLYTIYIGKDLRTDRSWSPLKGHVMFTDPILEKNVKK